MAIEPRRRRSSRRSTNTSGTREPEATTTCSRPTGGRACTRKVRGWRSPCSSGSPTPRKPVPLGYRDAVLTVTLRGTGNVIRSFNLDGTSRRPRSTTFRPPCTDTTQSTSPWTRQRRWAVGEF
jgi:hypothetical protein